MKEKEKVGVVAPAHDPLIKESYMPLQVNLGVSGKLAEDTNMYKGVLIKYNEPPEAKKPTIR